MKPCAHKCVNRHLRPRFKGRQWRISRLLRSFAEADNPPQHQSEYEHSQDNSARDLQNRNRKSLECIGIQRLHLKAPIPVGVLELTEPPYQNKSYAQSPPPCPSLQEEASVGFVRIFLGRLRQCLRFLALSAEVAAVDPLRNVLNQLQPLQLQPAGADVSKIVLRLLHQPAFGAASENLRELHGHFRRYTALLVHQFR